MAKAIFLGGESLFFTLYVLFAEAFNVLPDSTVERIEAPEQPETGGGILEALDGFVATWTFGFDLIARFFQLLTFQAPGQTAESLVTAVIFVPLTFITGWIILSTIRGV
jgi:hypothetical protein